MTKTAELMAKDEKDITVGDFLALSKAQRGALMYRLNKRLSNQMYGMQVDVHLHLSLDTDEACYRYYNQVLETTVVGAEWCVNSRPPSSDPLFNGIAVDVINVDDIVIENFQLWKGLYELVDDGSDLYRKFVRWQVEEEEED